MTTRTTTRTAWTYATKDFPQKREHTLATGRAYVARRFVKERLTWIHKPRKTGNDPTVVTVPATGARDTALERDITCGVKLQRREAHVEQAQRRVGSWRRIAPDPNTGEELEGACGVGYCLRARLGEPEGRHRLLGRVRHLSVELRHDVPAHP